MKHPISFTLACALVAAVVSAVLPSTLSARLKPEKNAPSGGVNIDLYIGYWKDSKPRRLYGALEVRDILTRCAGDPLRPARKGAVLTGLNTVSYGTLAPKNSTKPTTLSGVQHVLYVASGWGTIRSGTTAFDIRQGFGIIIPPRVEFTIANSGDKPLTLYIIEEPVPGGFIPRKNLAVKNDFDTPMSTNLHRADSRGWLFGRRDSLASLTGVDPVVFLPRSFVSPHVHLPGDEEIWIALDDMDIQIGNQHRELPEGSAYKVPADGRTPHVNINDSDREKRLLWLMRSPGAPIEREPEKENGGKLRDMI
jgi:mannose-6-phosphate isomerase-like protein (cupin superfamily)